MEAFIFLIVVTVLMTVSLVLVKRVNARKHAQEEQYQAWLREHGLKPKEKR